VGPDITWYEVLGVLPTAPKAEVKDGYDAKAALLTPNLLADASSTVMDAVSRAQQILDAAWWALGDATRRAAYDEAIGIRHPGEGLAPHYLDPSDPGWGPSETELMYDAGGAAVMGGLLAVADFLGPHPAHPHHISVPDVRGLFIRECMLVTGKMGFRLTVVRLTEHPMPVEGLVVDQSPAPQHKAHRESPLTVHVWHPPRAHP
jgi:hypothetical protein